MKRFIKTYTISRIGMIIVKHDSDARVFRVLQWDADDEHHRELESFRYVPKEHARAVDVKMHQAQDEAIRYASRVFERERDARRSEIQAAR